MTAVRRSQLPPPTIPHRSRIRWLAAAHPADVADVASVLATACVAQLRPLLAEDRDDGHAVALHRWFAAVTAQAVVHGAVYLYADDLAAAIWLPADAAALNLDGDIRSVPELDTLSALLRRSPAAAEPATVPAYLVAVGTDPGRRGRGAARQLLEAHHRKLDAAGEAAYAIAVDPIGKRLLAAAGYQPDHVDHAGVLALQRMRRLPRTRPGGGAW
ncbi:hypothetical protein [Dactylosporangium sp. CA-233914]|uniref:hypothetical protein n=1 Tax=Dactylosporangium sp. CA-233914 TaxID=3239934 RepID=UPI003D8D34BF